MRHLDFHIPGGARYVTSELPCVACRESGPGQSVIPVTESLSAQYFQLKQTDRPANPNTTTPVEVGVTREKKFQARSGYACAYAF
jgi:hypothetical protein